MKHVLLTGGTGFIGHHTVEHLLKETDWNVTIIDALTYAGDMGRLVDIEGFDPTRVRTIWHDLRAPLHDYLIERIGPVDYVINMASGSHVDRSITDPVPFVRNNVDLVLHMLEYARVVQPEKFIQVSTDEVYGPAPEAYKHREWDTILPSNPYSASKAAQEAIAFSYWRTYGVPLAITNTMNNFGERQNVEKYVPLVIQRLLRDQVVQVHAQKVDGEWVPGSRVWLHARNHADALLFLLRDVDFPQYDGISDDRPFRVNVVGKDEVDNATIVQMVADVLDVPARYECTDFHSSRPGHDLRYALDDTRLRELGWRPPLDLEESFERTVRWFDEHREWLA